MHLSGHTRLASRWTNTSFRCLLVRRFRALDQRLRLREVLTASLHTGPSREGRLSTRRQICSTCTGRSQPPSSDKHCRYSSETPKTRIQLPQICIKQVFDFSFKTHPTTRPCLKRTAPVNRRVRRSCYHFVTYNIVHKMSSFHRIIPLLDLSRANSGDPGTNPATSASGHDSRDCNPGAGGGQSLGSWKVML